jgi:putative NADPH-quinone reductase
MSVETKRFVVISASPRTDEASTSEFLAVMGAQRMKENGAEIYRVNVRRSLARKLTETDFAAMLRADALVLIFPLYFFCLPGLLMRFLEDYYKYYEQHKENSKAAKVYAVINCGFPEPDINAEAARVIESFSEKTGGSFRFSVLIGGGGMLQSAKDAPFMKKTLAAIKGSFGLMAEDTFKNENKPIRDILVSIRFPRKLYFLMGGFGWKSAAKKNGLKKEDLYRTPYREA